MWITTNYDLQIIQKHYYYEQYINLYKNNRYEIKATKSGNGNLANRKSIRKTYIKFDKVTDIKELIEIQCNRFQEINEVDSVQNTNSKKDKEEILDALTS